MLKQTLVDILTSKKALMTIAGGIVALVAHFGLHVDATFVSQEVALVAAYVVGQGLSDTGKAAAQIHATAMAANSTIVKAA